LVHCVARTSLVLLSLAATAAWAAPARRFAIIVGNDEGTGARPALRYAEIDATRMARVVAEVGEVKPEDVTLLLDKRLADVEGALAQAKAKISEAHKQRGTKAMLFFYYSGHSDGEALELGTELLAFPRLKALLAGSGADVKLAVVDACNSSALLQAGGKPAAAFAIEAEDQLLASGDAFITSSAADESSLESGELKGSVFTHHLLSGLRGAADRSGDMLVSLDELYRYAYDRTITSTGAQHPGYGFRLSGQGELIVSSLKNAHATLRLPDSADRMTITDASGGEVSADLDAGSARVLALPAGRYDVKARREGQAFNGKFSIKHGVRGAMSWNDLAPSGQSVPTPNTAAGTPGIIQTSGK
jgi:hypothetical protein